MSPSRCSVFALLVCAAFLHAAFPCQARTSRESGPTILRTVSAELAAQAIHIAPTAQRISELESLDDETRARGRAIAARIALARARWEGLRDGRVLTIVPLWSTPDRLYGYDVLVGTSQRSEDPTHVILARWFDAHASADSAAIQSAPALAWITVSASDAQPPILASGRGVPPALGSLAAAAEIAIALSDARDVRLQRVYATGILGRLYEYATEGRSWMVSEGPSWRYGDAESVRALLMAHEQERTGHLRTQEGEAAADLETTAAALTDLYASAARAWLEGTAAAASVTTILGLDPHFEHFERYSLREDMSSVIAPSIAQVLNYFDNRLDYGRLISSFVRTLDLSLSSETYVCHVPDAADVFLDYFQSEEPTEYAHVMRTYANSRGYAFTTGIDTWSNVLNWRFAEGKAEIDQSIPFVLAELFPVSLGSPAMTVIGYDTTPSPPEWIVATPQSFQQGTYFRAPTSLSLYEEMYYASVRPGGAGTHSAHLTFPDGSDAWEDCEPFRTFTSQSTMTIRWENWGNPAHHVALDYSPDGGATWQPIVSDRVDVGWYNWEVSCVTTDHGRIRLRQYDASGVLQSADGSIGDFRVIDPDCTPPVLVSPADGATCVNPLQVRLTWEPRSCAAQYQVLLMGPSGAHIYHRTTSREAVLSTFGANVVHHWQVQCIDACGNGDAWSPQSTFVTGANALAAPLLVTPVDDQSCLPTGVNFAWNLVPGALGYELEIGSSCGARESLHTTTQTQVSVTLPYGVTRTWRVRAIDACEVPGTWSECRTFTVSTDPLGAPSLVEPADGASAVPREVTLRWAGIEGATGYEVRVGIACGAGAVVARAAEQTSYAPPLLADRTTYWWQVRTRDACGQYGPWSACASFTTREPATYVVKPDGSGDYPTIVDAVNSSIDGDVIELADGVFRGAGNRDIDFGTRRIVIRAQNSDPTACVIDLEASPTDMHRGFRIANGQGAETVLEGFTIRNADLGTTSSGACVQIVTCSPILRRLHFEFGEANAGGGVQIIGAGTALVEDCVFTFCRASDAGGGAAVNTSTPTFRRCIFRGGSAVWAAGGVYAYAASPVFEGCQFLGNHSDHWGGALHATQASSRPQVIESTFLGNVAPEGSALYARVDATWSISGSIVAFGELGAAAHCITGGTIEASCSVVHGNAGGDWVGGLSGQEVLRDNLVADPLFCNAAALDVTLHRDSPCLAAATCGRIGAGGIGCGPALPLTVRVRPDGQGDYPDIQSALDDLPDASTILLADGIFRGTGNRDLDFGGKRITLRSESGDAVSCVLDAEGNAAAPHRHFHFGSIENGQTIVADLTLRGGYSTEHAGSVWVRYGASPLLQNISFEQNVAIAEGGAVLVEYAAAPRFEQCEFRGNHAGVGGSAIAVQRWGAPTFMQVRFRENASVGGCVSAGTAATPTLLDCIFDGNLGTQGAALRVLDDAAVSVQGSSFVRNTLLARAVTASVVAVESGGSLSMTRSIIAFNFASSAMDVEEGAVANVVISCSDFFANSQGDWTETIAHLQGVDGNICVDPWFCDLDSGDLRLAGNSPCSVEYSADCGGMGAQEVGCSAVAVEVEPLLPTRVRLRSPFPNPSHVGCSLVLEIPGALAHEKVRVIVFDTAGRRVRTLIDAPTGAGVHLVSWRGDDESGQRVGAGVYFVRLGVAGHEEIRSVVWLR